uniref:Uncharacterized protein n=1 Tax=Lepeophtheirus salmonis TaxID=72036 RepID=A0A0K2TA48_LEPSM
MLIVDTLHRDSGAEVILTTSRLQCTSQNAKRMIANNIFYLPHV